MLLGSLVAALKLVAIVFLFGPFFASFDRFAGHVARIVMMFARSLFARQLLIRILIVRHGTLLWTLEDKVSNGVKFRRVKFIQCRSTREAPRRSEWRYYACAGAFEVLVNHCRGSFHRCAD